MERADGAAVKARTRYAAWTQFQQVALRTGPGVEWTSPKRR